jgi:arylsulfatase A-like enzyme
LGAYGDVVEELDSRMGQIFDVLKDRDLDKKTIVVFLSDNGPEPNQKKWARSKPFRGLKWSALEGGNRVPCIVRWPGVIPAGRTSAEITAAIDLLPTLAHACGIDLTKITSDTPKIDGVNVWDTLTVKPSSRHARTDLLYWHGWGVLQAIRVGDWKLYLDLVKEVPGTSEGPVLVNLVDDPAEQTNLSDKHPERVQSMKTLALERLADIEANGIPLGGPADNRKTEKTRGLWLK